MRAVESQHPSRGCDGGGGTDCCEDMGHWPDAARIGGNCSLYWPSERRAVSEKQRLRIADCMA